MTDQTALERPSGRSTLIVVLLASAAMVSLAMGLRQAFGVFLAPISEDLQAGRDLFGLAFALQNLIFGLASPFAGAICGRFGPKAVAIGGGLLYALGLAGASQVTSAFGLHLTLGLLIGLALGGATYVTALAAVARVCPPERRTLAFGAVTAAGSLGMFFMPPLSQALDAAFGWREAFLFLGGAGLLCALFGGLLPGRDKTPHTASAQADLSLPQALSLAARHRGYWLLNLGFFVCGFHVTFLAAHLPTYYLDGGLDGEVAALAFALIGLFNMVGSMVWGALGDRYDKRYLLSLLYFLRAVLMVAFIALPLTPLTAYGFGALIGFLWLGTVPLTSGLVGTIFGARHLATLYGVVFLFHQIGAFLGAWGAGLVFEDEGSYDLVWIASIGLGLLATACHIPIDARPVTKPSPVSEPSLP